MYQNTKCTFGFKIMAFIFRKEFAEKSIPRLLPKAIKRLIAKDA